jgi:hypothetical protein
LAQLQRRTRHVLNLTSLGQVLLLSAARDMLQEGVCLGAVPGDRYLRCLGARDGPGVSGRSGRWAGRIPGTLGRAEGSCKYMYLCRPMYLHVGTR